MSCFAGFVGEGGLLLAFKELLEFNGAMWNDEQHARFGKFAEVARDAVREAAAMTRDA